MSESIIQNLPGSDNYNLSLFLCLVDISSSMKVDTFKILKSTQVLFKNAFVTILVLVWVGTQKRLQCQIELRNRGQNKWWSVN